MSNDECLDLMFVLFATLLSTLNSCRYIKMRVPCVPKNVLKVINLCSSLSMLKQRIITHCTGVNEADGDPTKTPTWHFKAPRKDSVIRSANSSRRIFAEQAIMSARVPNRTASLQSISLGIVHNWRGTDAISPFSRTVLINRPSQNRPTQAKSVFRLCSSKAQISSRSPLPLFEWIYGSRRGLCACVGECSVLFAKRGKRRGNSKLLHVFVRFGMKTMRRRIFRKRWSSAIQPTRRIHTRLCNMPKKRNSQAKSCKEHEKSRKEENHFHEINFRNFLLYLFAKRRWSWFCFQLRSKRQSQQTGKKFSDGELFYELAKWMKMFVKWIVELNDWQKIFEVTKGFSRMNWDIQTVEWIMLKFIRNGFSWNPHLNIEPDPTLCCLLKKWVQFQNYLHAKRKRTSRGRQKPVAPSSLLIN